MVEADAWLAAVTVTVPETMRTFLVDEALRRADILKGRIAAIIAARDVINEPRKRQELASSGPETLERLKARFEAQASPASKRLVALLDELMPVTGARTRNSLWLQALSDKKGKVVLNILLPAMFEVVAGAMLPGAWSDEVRLDKPLADGEADQIEDSTLGFTHTVDL